ncbi:hypothetical protein HCN44_003252 [Aphidius gifuensis]|uniref:C-type lectin domain-containing protein n=1 Tax=Aphidius gifuensis TaxID=684658 RepID=A0A834XLD0_APHGI|nr:hemolymph lipopolysaccharide-binding protein-like [Aphidius gifuensis]KAF7987490.1 hypothetical protein HCN44_003252 [Aphidius gifuensis]
MLLLLILGCLITSTIGVPVDNVADNTSQISPVISSTPPCVKLVDDRNLPQLNFPVCTSKHSSDTLTNVILHGMACTCDLNNNIQTKRDDYHYVTGVGAYKIHTRGTTFNNARRICDDEGGHLAIINSAREEQVLLEIFSQINVENFKNVSNREEAFIGIHDLFEEDHWVTILGDTLHKNGYSKWSERWGGQPDNGGGVQHCGALMKEGGMDDVNCKANFAFICEIPEIKIPRY